MQTTDDKLKVTDDRLLFQKSKELMSYGNKQFTAWCRVRNELNKLRRKDEVVYTEPEKHPYYPRRFPSGIWELYRPIPHLPNDPYLCPWFIPTSAHQEVEVWELKDGLYYKPTGGHYEDSGYGIHFSTSSTTLGCIRVEKVEDINWLADIVSKQLSSGKRMFIEVQE